MKFRLRILLGILILAAGFIAGPACGWDDANVLLTDSDLPGLKLTGTTTLNDTWPVVRKLPDYMQHPEDPPAVYPANPLDTSKQPDAFSILSPTELETSRNDGFRQRWLLGDMRVTVDYGRYGSPQQALDSLCYIVYERSLPYANQYWAPTYESYQPAMVYPICRRLDYGDLAYFVSPYSGSGGMVFFVKGNYIFMVDSVQQSAEDKVIQALLKKL